MFDIHIDPNKVLFFFLYYFRILFFLIPHSVFSFGVLPTFFLAHLVFALSWIYVYSVPPPPDAVIPTNIYQLGLLIFKEALLGFLLGFFVRVLFYLFIVLGELINLHTGLAMANLMVPGMGSMGVFGNLIRVMGGLLFFVLGGLEVMFLGLKLSFEIVPITKFDPFVLNYDKLTLLLVKIFTLSLALALPIIAIYILVNLVLALTNRLVPNVNIFFVGYPMYMLANFLVLVLLAPSLGLVSERIIKEYLTMYIHFIKSFPK